MQIRQNTWILLSTALLVTLTSRSSFAFTVNQSPGFFDYGAYSIFLGKGQGYTTLNAADPEDPFSLIKSRPFVSAIELGGTSGLLSDLQIYRNNDWTFNRGSNLKGSFNVKRQYACGNLTLCGAGTKLSIGLGGIGSVLELNYRPSKSERNPDPNPTEDNLFWIQRVITNYSPGQPGIVKATSTMLTL